MKSKTLTEEGDFNSEIELSLESFQFTFLNQQSLRLITYLSEWVSSPLALMTLAPPTYTEVNYEQLKQCARLRIAVHNPIIVIPRHPLKMDTYF